MAGEYFNYLGCNRGNLAPLPNMGQHDSFASVPLLVLVAGEDINETSAYIFKIAIFKTNKLGHSKDVISISREFTLWVRILIRLC